MNAWLGAMLHLHRGLTHIFPGNTTVDLHFLLVGFLAGKTGKHISFRNDDSNAPDPGMTAHLSNHHWHKQHTLGRSIMHITRDQRNVKSRSCDRQLLHQMGYFVWKGWRSSSSFISSDLQYSVEWHILFFAMVDCSLSVFYVS
jgi:hypothetical protein